jgi:hypothetical protein
MADLDLETLERAVRWCAEAGRQTTSAEVSAALGGLGWDELLAARSLLADPPPGRPLGPYALADLARGAPADVAVEREQGGRYPRFLGPAAATAPAPPAGQTGPGEHSAPRKRGKGRRAVIVRKKVAAPPPAAPPPRPLLDELLLPAGRATLERLVRLRGGRRPALIAALAASHRRPDALPPGEADLERLLEHHGLTRSFARRERDEVLHAVRAASGVMARAAEALGYDPAGLAAAAERLGCAAEIEAFRAGKRRDLSGRATLSDRARLVLADPEKLGELGLLVPFEAELRSGLPELLKVLARAGEPLALALARSLSLPVRGVRELAVRLGLELGPVSFAETAAGDRPPQRFRLDQPERPPRSPRPEGPKAAPPRTGRAPAGAARPGGRPGARPGGRPPPRSGGSLRPAGERPQRAPGAGARPRPGAPADPGGGGLRTPRPRGGPPRPPGAAGRGRPPRPAASSPARGRGGPAPAPRRPGPRPGAPARRPPRTT